ncbi:MAG: alpha/beta hydrolase [Syntrophales bacterium]|nr:alpha/beta hydrolase [Syntrophales bacterium]
MDTKIPQKLATGGLNWKRGVRSTGLIALSVYIFFLLYGIFFGDRLIFQPQPSSYTDTNQILKLKTINGAIISVLYLPNPGAAYTILYSHGNAEDLGNIREVLNQFHQHGFSVIAYDYSGYGTSSGKPSEDASYADISAVYEYAVREIGLRPENILLIGRSVGGGPSLDLAVRKTVGGLILESSFVSAFRVVTTVPLFPVDKFNNLNKIKALSCPVLVIHGKQDSIIPFWHGERLYDEANPPKMKFWVDAARHNDVMWSAGKEYWDTVERFVALVEDRLEN